MKKLNVIMALISSFMIFQSCGNSEVDNQKMEAVNEADEMSLMTLGDSITMHAQQVLMSSRYCGECYERRWKYSCG